MRWNLRIGQRLGLGYGLLVLLLLAVVGTSFSGLNAYGDLLEGEIKIAQQAERARSHVLGMRRFEKDMFLNVADRAEELEYEAKWREQLAQAVARFGDIQRNATAQPEVERLAEMLAMLARYETAFNHVAAMIAKGR